MPVSPVDGLMTDLLSNHPLIDNVTTAYAALSDDHYWGNSAAKREGTAALERNVEGFVGPYQCGWLPMRRPITSKVSVTTTNASGSRARMRCLRRDNSRKVITV